MTFSSNGGWVMSIIFGEWAVMAGWLRMARRLDLKRSAGTYCPRERFLLASFAPNHIVCKVSILLQDDAGDELLTRNFICASCGVGKTLEMTSRAWSVL